MSYSPMSVAKLLTRLADENNSKITQMQLQKLTYIAHGYKLAINDEPLLNEPVTAWKFGPVFPSLYRNFKMFANSPIPSLVETNDDDKMSPDDIALIGAVFDVYGDMSGIKLSEMTHRKGTPWEQTWNGNSVFNAVIPNSTIKDYYSKILEQGNSVGL